MKNKEKFAKEIVELIVNKHDVAVFNGNLVACDDINCSECDLSGNCRSGFKEWAESEYIEPKYETDWSKVPVDTPVISSCGNRYYFAGYHEGNSFIDVFFQGCTSWSSENFTNNVSKNAIELAREEDKIKYRKIKEV